MKQILAITAVMLILPSTAQAIDKPTGTICDTRPGMGANCVTVSDDDTYRQDVTEKGVYASWANLLPATGTYQMGQLGCTYAYASKDAWIASGSPRTANTCVPVPLSIAGHEFDEYLFADIPVADKGRVNAAGNSLPAVAHLTVQEFYGDGVFIKRGDVWVTRTNSNVLDAYCSFYRHRDAGAPTKFAEDATPTSVYDACRAINYFTGRWSERPAQVVTVPAATTVSVFAPATSARCGSIGKVTVRTTRMACAPARFIIARYARTLRSPAGWTCRAVVTDAGRRAGCTRKVATRTAATPPTVYGIWRG